MKLRLATLAAVLIPCEGAAHPGRIAADGCHRDAAANERHCHGPNETTPERNWARATVRVDRVVDGDTVKVTTRDVPPVQLTVRLRGLDCPETRMKGGPAATAHLKARVHGKVVVLQSGTGTFEKDQYGRTLAYIERMGVDLGEELIAQRLCSDFSHKYPHARQERYLQF